MNRLTIGSIVTATLLLVGCGGGSDGSTATPSAPANNGVNKKIEKGYYIDSAVQGVNYQCGNESGTTDENGTFTFESNSSCNFTLGGVQLREINASLLENNITILETNETVAQLLQTLDSDGNASNGIQIPKGAGSILKETLPSLDNLNQDLLEAVHDRLKAEHSNEYHGRVVDRNQTIAHLNRTKADLAERHTRTSLDVEEEHRGRGDSNSTFGNIRGSGEGRDSNGTQEHSGNLSASQDENRTSHIELPTVSRDSNNTQEQEHSGRASTQDENSQRQNNSGRESTRNENSQRETHSRAN